jgi:hypothetical protein
MFHGGSTAGGNGRVSLHVDWVRAIASEPNMHPIHRRFNLNAVGSYLARRKQREQHGELLTASEDCLARLEAVANKNSPQGL